MSRTIGKSIPSFIIDSANRDDKIGSDGRPNTNRSSFVYTIDISKNSKFNCVAMSQARIPKAWYTVQTIHANNTFELHEGGSSATITIAEGNYNVYSFMNILTGLLNTNSPNGWTYSITFPDSLTDVQTFKYTFSVSGNGGVQPMFEFTSSSSRISELMGFDFANDVYNGENPFVGDSLESYTQVYFQLTKFITVKSNICSNSGNSDSDSSVLARIDVTHVHDGDTIVWNMSSLEDASRVIPNNNSNVYTFSLFDDKGRPLNIHDDWNIVLLLYEYNPVSEYMINDLKLKYLKDPEEEEALQETPTIESGEPLRVDKPKSPKEKKKTKK